MLILGLVFSLFSFATDRAVSIAVPDGTLTLTNSSDVTVTYDVECYDRTTGNNILTGNTGLTLTAKATTKHEAPDVTCNGSSLVKNYGGGVGACDAGKNSTNFATAGSRCGPGSHLCTLADLSTRGTSLANSPEDYWINPEGNPWSSQTTANGKWSDKDLTGGKKKNYAARTESKNANACNNGTNGTGSATIAHCSAEDQGSSIYGSICCSDFGGDKVASCKVTIKSATPTGGFLQSPQFKGGTAF